MGWTDVDRDAVIRVIAEHEKVGRLLGAEGAAAGRRPPLVLIAPSYGNAATRRRFHDTLAEPVDFLVEELRDVLTDDETQTLLSLHPERTARFWGALASHNSIIDRLQQGDVIVFTGQNRVQAIGTLGCRLRNEALGRVSKSVTATRLNRPGSCRDFPAW
ncbi:hypothetical protein ACFQ3X_36380, partial [Plantactinospora endophytica]